MAKKQIDLNDSGREMAAIGSAIFDPEVTAHSLVTEVVWSALHFMKTNPTATISDAMEYGYNEWIK